MMTLTASRRSSRDRISSTSTTTVVALIAACFVMSPYGVCRCDELLRLPDGTTELLKSKGDSDFIFFEDQAGYSLMKVKDRFEYAKIDLKTGHLVPSGHIKGQVDPETVGIPQGVRFSSRRIRGIGPDDKPGGPEFQRAVGEFNVLIIPMRFSNHRERELPDSETLHRIFNRDGGDPEHAPVGSVRDYMREVSYGQFTPTLHVLPWIDLPKPESHYAEWTEARTIANGYRLDEACFHALGAADTDFPSLDLSEFDRNGDGYLDAVGFLHSGYGSEAGGSDPDGVPYSQRINSMQYTLPEWTSRTGLKVRKVAVVAGLFGRLGNGPCRVGVLSHEAGHLIGLPDLYNTRSHYETDTGAGIGVWGLLGDSWGFDRTQHYPMHMSPWTKLMLKWVEPEIIDKPGEYTARAVETFPDVFKITRGFPAGEYLLIENRQPVGFDRQIPAGSDGRKGGLAVWHVDDRKTSENDPGYPGYPGFPRNNSHLRVALLQADGRNDLERGGNHGDGDDLFRATGIAETGPGTNPNTNSYQLGVVRQTGIRIYRISESAEKMTFCVDFLPIARSNTANDLETAAKPTQPNEARRPTEPTANAPDRELTEAPQVLRELVLELDEPATVSVTGVAMLRSTVARQTVEIALTQETAVWRTSRRIATFERTDQLLPLKTTIVRTFPAGRHTLRLILKMPEGKVDVEPETSLVKTIVGADRAAELVVRESNVPAATTPQPPAPRTTSLPFLTYIDLDAPRSQKSVTSTPEPSAVVSSASTAAFGSSPGRVPVDIVWADIGGRKPTAFAESGFIASVTIKLAKSMDVRLTTAMSFASPGERNTILLSLTDSEDPKAPGWPDSLQRIETSFADQCVSHESQTTKRLPQGTHTIYWRIQPEGDAPTYAIGGGIITAELLSAP
jgi:M6 family metalloprotease-like protein